MKKVLSIVLAAIMLFAAVTLASCSKDDKSKVKVFEEYELTAEKYAFAVAKENTELKEAANALLAELKANG